MVSTLDDALISAAEYADRLGPELTRLSDWYESRMARERKIRSGIMLPALVLTLAAFVQLLPALIGGDFTLILLAAGRTLLVLAAFLIGVAGLYQALQGRQAPKAKGLDRIRLSISLLGAHHQRGQIVTLLSAFKMLYTAGLPPDRAISIAARTLSNAASERASARL